MIELDGAYWVEHLDENGKILDSFPVPNGVPAAALTDLLNVYFAGGLTHTSWYIGLINNAGFTGLSINDVASSHPGWQEWQGYTATTRPPWAPAISNATATTGSSIGFTFNAAGVVNGIFLGTTNTKGGTGGLLFSTAQFPSPKTVALGQTFRVIYNLIAAGGG